jgi:serine/threonine protein kinase
MRLKAFDVSGKSVYVNINKDKKLGEGATASVYQVDLAGQQYAAKIYKPERVFSPPKLKAMMASPPQFLGGDSDSNGKVKFTWVNHLLKDQDSEVVGFLMPFVDQADTNSLDTYYDPVLIKRLSGVAQAALSLRIEIARNLCRLIAELHSLGHYFVDIKPQNIRVYKDSHDVVLMDCDGYSIKNDNNPLLRFPADLISTDYIAPEVLKNNISPKLLGEEQDRYGIAVILFQLLNRGTHPFQGIVTNPSIQVSTNDERAALGLYPHGVVGNPAVKPRAQSIHELFLPETRSLFDRAFTGSIRPTAREWVAHFDEILLNKRLSRCSLYPSDVRHIHFKDMGCIGCKLRSETPTQKAVKKAADFGIDYRKPQASSYGSRTFPALPASNPGSLDKTSLVFLTAAIVFFAFFILISTGGSGTSTTSSSASSALPSNTSGSSGDAGGSYSSNKQKMLYLEGATGSKEIKLDTIRRGNIRSGYDVNIALSYFIDLENDIVRELSRVQSSIRIEDGLFVYPKVNLLYLSKFTLGGTQGECQLDSKLQPLGVCLVAGGDVKCQLLDRGGLRMCISSFSD